MLPCEDFPQNANTNNYSRFLATQIHIFRENISI